MNYINQSTRYRQMIETPVIDTNSMFWWSAKLPSISEKKKTRGGAGDGRQNTSNIPGIRYINQKSDNLDTFHRHVHFRHDTQQTSRMTYPTTLKTSILFSLPLADIFTPNTESTPPKTTKQAPHQNPSAYISTYRSLIMAFTSDWENLAMSSSWP